MDIFILIFFDIPFRAVELLITFVCAVIYRGVTIGIPVYLVYAYIWLI